MQNNEFSDVAIKLVNVLRGIYNDRNFIIGVLTYANEEDDKIALLEFIEHTQNVTDEMVSLAAMELNQRRRYK